MNINFDLSNSCQSKRYFNNLMIKSHGKIIEFSEQYKDIQQFIGLPFVVCSISIALSSRVAAIGESFIKGLVNIFGSLFSENCNFVRGLRQVILETTGRTIHLLIHIPFLLLSTVIIPVGVFLFPKELIKHYKDSNKKMMDEENMMINQGEKRRREES